MSNEDPIEVFQAWFAEARERERGDATAMNLATVGADGAPSSRMVLLKHADARGFVFYTNLESRKGQELLAEPRVALCIHWRDLERQVRIEGRAEPVSDAEADAYFASRDRISQLGAWASKQSRPMEGRLDLERRMALYTARFHVGAVPRPPHWHGFRVVPRRIELWQQIAHRLHDRRVFERRSPDGDWQAQRLYP